MDYTVKDIKDELSSDNRLELEITDDNILLIQSDDFTESPFGEIDEVQVYKTENGRFDARPVGGGERFEMTFKNTIHYITESLLK